MLNLNIQYVNITLHVTCKSMVEGLTFVLTVILQLSSNIIQHSS